MTPAILFDLDGTLIRTLGGHMRAWREVLARHGAELPVLLDPWVSASIERTLGAGGHSGLLPRRVFGPAGIDRATALQLVAEKRALYLHNAGAWTEAEPWMAEALGALADRGFSLAVQTTTHQDLARFLLRARFGAAATRRFRAIVGGNDVKQLKPHPGGLLEAARRLGARPEDCLVVGDSRLDLLAAAVAQMTMIVFHPGRKPPRWAARAAASTAEAAALPVLAPFLAEARPRGVWLGATVPGFDRTKNRGFSATLVPPRQAAPASGRSRRQRVYVKAYTEEPAVRSHAEWAAIEAMRAAVEAERAAGGASAHLRVPGLVSAMDGYLVMRHEPAVAANASLGTRLLESPQDSLELLDPAVRCALRVVRRTAWPAGVTRKMLFDDKFQKYAVDRVVGLATLWKWPEAARTRHEQAVSAAELAIRGSRGGGAMPGPGEGVPLMHGDLKLDNIVTAGRELWLIDFEHARACTPGDVTFDLATVAVDTLIRGALVRRRYWPQVAAVVRGWLEGGTDPSFPPCFLLASAIQGGTLRPGRKAYPLAPPFGPSHKAIFRSLMEAAFAVVLDEASTAEAVDGYWEGLRGKWGAS